ncbi:NAD-P-binding protein [Panus rudis PR-1116 ss-1]|nr:NAD-P-binding protein [Panus rudis PR-1116 ss-1]
MPAIQPPATILVTGVSGFAGTWVARALLEAGYSVRGTVRSDAKVKYLQELFKEHAEKFATVVVPDIAKQGAYDTAIDENIEGVVHVAGVTDFTNDPPPSGTVRRLFRHVSRWFVTPATSKVLGPNTEGVKWLLESLHKNAPNMKRLVYISSAQALLGKELGHIYTEDDWNNQAVTELKEKRDDVDGQALFAASKVLAERTIIEFIQKHEEDVHWDATRLVPTWLYGPIIHECQTLDELNFSSKLFYRFCTAKREPDKVNQYCSDFIDVRDLADACVAALGTEEAGGERFVLGAGAFTYQNLYDAIRSAWPDAPGVPIGNKEAEKVSFPHPFVNSDKARKVLKLKEFRTLSECGVDALKSFRERGF